MSIPFTVGIEEEFQLVDPHTYDLHPYIERLLEDGQSTLGENLKAEYFQALVELTTGIHTTIASLETDLRAKRDLLSSLAYKNNVALMGAGTHPFSLWQNQTRMERARYTVLEYEQRDVVRAGFCCGLHIHIGIPDQEMLIALMNQLRSYIPHLVALSANSPFYNGRLTGFQSYRTIVRRQLLIRHGVSNAFPSWKAFDEYIESLIATGLIESSRDIWWDIRPHLIYHTLEFRMCDMVSSLEESLALAAICQALVVKSARLYKHNQSLTVQPQAFIEENKWLAARDGMNAVFIDFSQGQRTTICQALLETFDFIDDVLDELGSREYIERARLLLEENAYQTGADKQLAIYHRTANLPEVAHFLVERTMCRAD